MNPCPGAKQLLVLMALSSGSMSATAGELGATSRGTISISVTVPPHVVVSRANIATSEASGTGSALCIGTNGLRQFHVAFVGTSGAPATTNRVPPSRVRVDQAAERAACPSSDAQTGSFAENVAGQFLAGESAANEPVTLLIVPE